MFRVLGASVVGLLVGGAVGLLSRPKLGPPPSDASLPELPAGELDRPREQGGVAPVLGPDCPRPYQPDLTSHAPEVVWHPDDVGVPVPSERVGDIHLLTNQDGGWEEHAVPEGPFEFAAYQGRLPMPIGDVVNLQGVPTLMGQLVVEAPASEVLLTYGRQFDLNHVRPMVGMPMGEGGPMYLTFRPEGGTIRKMINIIPQGDRTLVLASVSDTANFQKPGEAVLPSSFPTPEGAEGVQVNDILDGNTHQSNVSFVLPQKKVDQARPEYERVLKEAGFTPSGADWQQRDNKTTWVRAFGREGESLTVTLLERDKIGVVVDAVWVHN